MENYNKLIGFTKWKMHRLTGSSKDPLDVLHSAYLRQGDIYKSITNECFLLLREKWIKNQHRFGFNPPEEKKCNKCNEVLPSSEFRIIKELKYDVKRLCFICKKCENKCQLKRNKKYKQRMKKYVDNLPDDFRKALQEKYNTKNFQKIYSICKKLKV